MEDRESANYFGGSKFVTELSENNFDERSPHTLKEHKCSIVLFYAPWCPHCKAVKDTWEQLGEQNLFFDVVALNCEKNATHLEKIKRDLPELVKGFPTIIVYQNGEPIEQYKGDRTVADLTKVCIRACKGE